MLQHDICLNQSRTGEAGVTLRKSILSNVAAKTPEQTTAEANKLASMRARARGPANQAAPRGNAKGAPVEQK